MSESFKVVLDLSLVKDCKKENQLYIAFADTAKMKTIYDFKLWIKYLHSLTCSIELLDENAIVHDLEDIRVLSLVKIVQVRPLGNVEKEKSTIEKQLTSRLNEYNGKHCNLKPTPTPNDVSSKMSPFKSCEIVPDIASPQVGENVKTREVSKLGTNEKVGTPCGESFQADDETRDVIEKPKKNLVGGMNDRQESKTYKTFKFKNRSRMSENVKLDTLSRPYYRRHGNSNHNTLSAKCFCKETNKATTGELMESVKRQHCPDYALGGNLEKEEHISSDLNHKDVSISEKDIPIGTTSPVKLKTTKDRELCCKNPVREIESKGLTDTSNSDFDAVGSDRNPDAVRKPLTSLTTDADKKSSSTGVKLGGQSMSVNEILKMLRVAVVSRAKDLPVSNTASQNKVNSEINDICETSKTEAGAVDGRSNLQQNIKHKITSNNSDMLNENQKNKSLHQNDNTEAVNFLLRCNLTEGKKTKAKKKTGSGNKTQTTHSHTLFASSEKLHGNPLQCNPTEGKKESMYIKSKRSENSKG